MNIGSNSFPVEFNLADSPMVLVLADALSAFSSDSTFRQVEVVVTCARPDNGNQREFVFLVDVDGDDVTVDIASAVRSMIMDVELHPSMLEQLQIVYPYVELSVKFRAKYMVGGDILYGSQTESCIGTKAYAGRISDLDRMRISSHVADYYRKMRFTTKPKEGIEIVPIGERGVSTMINDEGKLVSSPYVVSQPGLQVLSDGRSVYGLEQDGNMFSVVFVNSLGVLDTATAICFESLKYGITHEMFSLNGRPDNLKVYGMEVMKSGGRAVLSMSSGFVSRRWADWWAEEVMRARKSWVKFGKRFVNEGDTEVVKDMWVPCILRPKDDSVQVYDRSSYELCYVEFELEICAEGSLLRSVKD